MFSYDPAYLNASASPPSDVGDYSCLDQAVRSDFQRAQMLFGGFTNANVDILHPPFTPASSSCFSDASTSSYFPNCQGSPATMASMPQTPASEIAFQPQVYDNSQA
jgi:hypothetical protein